MSLIAVPKSFAERNAHDYGYVRTITVAFAHDQAIQALINRVINSQIRRFPEMRDGFGA